MIKISTYSPSHKNYKQSLKLVRRWNKFSDDEIKVMLKYFQACYSCFDEMPKTPENFHDGNILNQLVSELEYSDQSRDTKS